MKKLLLLLIFPALFSCEDDPITPNNPTPTQPVEPKTYVAELYAEDNTHQGYIQINKEQFWVTNKVTAVKTGDTVRLLAPNAGWDMNIDESRISMRLDGELIFDIIRPGGQDTTVIIP